MNEQEIFQNLCSYDKRNPSFAELFGDEEQDQNKENCYCDNCFYGRDRLANKILRLMEEK
jgi:hypothetical protein